MNTTSARIAELQMQEIRLRNIIREINDWEHLFEFLKIFKNSTENIRKVAQKQKKINRRITTLTLLITICLITARINIQDQNKRIEKFITEIERLNQTEGD